MTRTKARLIGLRAAKCHVVAELEVILRECAIEKIELLNEEINTVLPHETEPELLEFNADGEEVFATGPEDILIQWEHGAYILKQATKEIVQKTAESDEWLREVLQLFTE